MKYIHSKFVSPSSAQNQFAVVQACAKSIILYQIYFIYIFFDRVEKMLSISEQNVCLYVVFIPQRHFEDRKWEIFKQGKSCIQLM